MLFQFCVFNNWEVGEEERGPDDYSITHNTHSDRTSKISGDREREEENGGRSLRTLDECGQERE